MVELHALKSPYKSVWTLFLMSPSTYVLKIGLWFKHLTINRLAVVEVGAHVQGQHGRKKLNYNN